MGKAEARFIGFIQKNIIALGFGAVMSLSLVLRLAFFDVVSGDWQFFLSNWLNQLAQYKGLSGIGHDIGEYNVPYMFFLNLTLRLPLKDLYEVKALSCIFDAVCAFAIIRIAFGKKWFSSEKSLAVFSIVMLSPISFLDSAYWAQCDSIYTACLLICLGCLLSERFLGAMIAFGAAFSLKLQAIFFLPVIVVYYFSAKKMSAKYLLAVPAVYFVTICPALIAGRGLTNTLGIYKRQTGLYPSLTMNCPNIFSLVTGSYEMFRKMGIILALTILGVGACCYIKRSITSGKAYVLFSLWSAMVCIYFLPEMHERYSYLACLLAVLYCAVCKRDIWVAVGINVVSLLSWTPYLFALTPVSFPYMSLANFVFIAVLTYRVFNAENEAGTDGDAALQQAYDEVESVLESLKDEPAPKKKTVKAKK